MSIPQTEVTTTTTTTKPQPIQPLYKDKHGTIRFQANALVRYILDHGGVTLNDLAMEDFPQEDRIQFAQLIGYSLSGFSELPYVTNDAHAAASRMAYGRLDERDVRIQALTETLDEVKDAFRAVIPTLFQIHPDDLRE